MLDEKLLKLLRLSFRNANRSEARAALLLALKTARSGGAVAVASLIEAASPCTDPDIIVGPLLKKLVEPIPAPAPNFETVRPRRAVANPGFCAFCLKFIGPALKDHVVNVHPEVRRVGDHDLDRMRRDKISRAGARTVSLGNGNFMTLPAEN